MGFRVQGSFLKDVLSFFAGVLLGFEVIFGAAGLGRRLGMEGLSGRVALGHPAPSSIGLHIVLFRVRM